jgi:uncharacterized lipoprotein YajG
VNRSRTSNGYRLTQRESKAAEIVVDQFKRTLAQAI